MYSEGQHLRSSLHSHSSSCMETKIVHLFYKVSKNTVSVHSEELLFIAVDNFAFVSCITIPQNGKQQKPVQLLDLRGK